MLALRGCVPALEPSGDSHSATPSVTPPLDYTESPSSACPSTSPNPLASKPEQLAKCHKTLWIATCHGLKKT